MSGGGRLGIVDWGIGGLDLYRRLRLAGSPRDVHYWSDAGAPPYGTLDSDALAQRLHEVLRRLHGQGCTDVVVACNAASTVLSAPPLQDLPLRIVGVIAPTLAALERRGLSEVAVIGGRRTIESRAYEAPLRAAGIRVHARVAQPLSALIERGVTDGPELHAYLDSILGPLRDVEHLVLACTHYVAVRAAIERRLPRLRSVIDPAHETLAWIERTWGAARGRGTARFVTTGSPQAMQQAARLAFGIELPQVRAVAQGRIGEANYPSADAGPEISDARDLDEHHQS
ncbi:MAG: aspartate/glutamate racemase family protein [Nannocystaceae bacterium]